MIELLLGMALVFGGTYYAYNSGYDAASNKAKAEQLEVARAANTALLAANAKAAAITAQYATLQQQIEVKAHEDQKIIDTTRRQLASIVRLRDPGYRPASDCKLPATTQAASAAADNPAPGDLSVEFSNFLKQQAYDADQVSIYAKTCHDWVVGLSEDKLIDHAR